jgi:hypothetical protein
VIVGHLTALVGTESGPVGHRDARLVETVIAVPAD